MPFRMDEEREIIERIYREMIMARARETQINRPTCLMVLQYLTIPTSYRTLGSAQLRD